MPNASLAKALRSLVLMSLSIDSIYAVLLLTPDGSCENAFISNTLSDIPFTTISTNLGIIGTGFQSKFK